MENNVILLANHEKDQPAINNDWDYIKALANKGLALYPLIKGTKKPLKNSHGSKDATTNISILKKMFHPDKNGNLANDVACVPQSINMLVIDIDHHKDKNGNETRNSKETTKWMRENASKIQPKVIERTKAGGLHLFYNANDLKAEELPNHLLIDDLIEVKTDSTIIYPSQGYKQTNGNSLVKTPLPATNAFLTDKIKNATKNSDKPTRKDIPNHSNKLSNKWEYILNLCQNGIPSGERNNRLSQIAENLYSFGFNDVGVETFIKYINDVYCSPALPTKEVDLILKNKRNKSHMVMNISDELAKSKSSSIGLSTYKNGSPKPNFLSNITTICSNDLAGKYKYNTFADDVFVKRGNKWNRWQDKDLYWLRNYIEKNYGFTPNNEKTTYQGVFQYAQQNKYHPVKKMIETSKWDGKPRIDRLFIDYLGAEDNEYNKMTARKFMVGAVTRIYHPGVKYELMPILTGNQGIGKSTLISKLAGNYFLDNLSQLNPSNKDDILKLQDSWIVEVSELEPFKHSTSGGIKAFISSQNLKYRKPYGGANSDYWVHNAYIGTTNENQFLTDATGNRRFLPVQCGMNKPNHDVFNISDATRYQIYAEAKYLMDNGEKIYLTKDEEALANDKRANNETYDPVKEAILEYIKMPIPKKWNELSEFDRRRYYSRYQDDGTTAIFDNNQKIHFNSNNLTNMKSIATKELLNIPLNQHSNPAINGSQRKLSRRVSIIFSGLHDWKQSKHIKLHGKQVRGYIKK